MWTSAMIQANKLTEFPTGNRFASYAELEMSRTNGMAKLLFNKSRRAWILKRNGIPLLLCGVWKPSLVSPYRVWLLTYPAFRKEFRFVLRYMRRALDRLLKVLKEVEFYVEFGQREPERFAAFFGFEPYGAIIPIDNIPYGRWRL